MIEREKNKQFKDMKYQSLSDVVQFETVYQS